MEHFHLYLVRSGNFFLIIEEKFEFNSFSAASMYNTHDRIIVDNKNETDEKRQADDKKTKQKMESIRSKLKTHPRKVNISLFIS